MAASIASCSATVFTVALVVSFVLFLTIIPVQSRKPFPYEYDYPAYPLQQDYDQEMTPIYYARPWRSRGEANYAEKAKIKKNVTYKQCYFNPVTCFRRK